jgi:hypothetical protein
LPGRFAGEYTSSVGEPPGKMELVVLYSPQDFIVEFQDNFPLVTFFFFFF